MSVQSEDLQKDSTSLKVWRKEPLLRTLSEVGWEFLGAGYPASAKIAVEFFVTFVTLEMNLYLLCLYFVLTYLKKS